MHLIILHGYLLQGTGSNIYVANIARAWARQGHAVTVVCQDLRAQNLPFVAEYIAPGDPLPAQAPPEGTVRVVVPEINRLLPVFVLDKYDGFEVKRIQDMSGAEIETHIRLTARVLRRVVRQRADGVLANHVLLSPVIAGRALENLPVPYDVKIHGSAVEYSLVPHPELMEYAVEGLQHARTIFTGTRYVKDRVSEVFVEYRETLQLEKKLRIVSPGMDQELFNLADDFAGYQRKFLENMERLQRENPNGRQRKRIEIPPLKPADSLHQRLVNLGETYDQRAVDADLLHRWKPLREDEPIILYFGKFLAAKGVGELLVTVPDILRKIPRARFIFVGFGTNREHLEAMIHSLHSGDFKAFVAYARAGNFVEKIDFRKFFRKLTPTEIEHILTTGILDHEALQFLLPLASLTIVPSKWPEAFGMVAVEAMAAGVFPLCNYHAGLRDVVDTVERVDPAMAEMMRLDRQNFVEQLPGAVERALNFLYPDGFENHRTRRKIGRKLRQIAVDNFSWDGIARKLIQPNNQPFGYAQDK